MHHTVHQWDMETVILVNGHDFVAMAGPGQSMLLEQDPHNRGEHVVQARLYIDVFFQGRQAKMNICS